MDTNINLAELTAEQKRELFAQLQSEQKEDRIQKREAYEGLRAQFLIEVERKTAALAAEVSAFKDWLDKEAQGFTELMREYGQVRREGQQSYTITDGKFKVEIASNKVKAFDERADMAAERLIDYLKGYMEKSEKGVDDPMYQMAMTLLERNKAGDLDYKSISKLYELEDRFDAEYGEIMSLFKEANVVQQTATNYYFSKRNPDTGVWTRIEPSFCRL